MARVSVLIGMVLVASCAPTSSSEPPPAEPARAAMVTVDPTTVRAEVDARFLSVAIDAAQVVGGAFWNPSGEVEGGAGEQMVPPYDFTRPALLRLARELAPAYLRIGGSEADKIFYDVDTPPLGAAPEPYTRRLTAEQWAGVMAFADDVGMEVLFTLNAGPGPRDANLDWQPDNARSLLQHAAARADPVAMWELGNEVNGFAVIHGSSFRIDGEQYAADLATVRALVDEITPGVLLGGPASAFWPDVGEFAGILEEFMPAGGSLLDVLTWHYYPLQSRRCPFAVVRATPWSTYDPQVLDEVDPWCAYVEELRAEHAPQAQVWLGETGGAQCGGEPGVSDAFAGGLWWLDELGLVARRGQPVVVRQTLSGSNYGLLDEATLTPNPDYWNSVLWRRLMGTRVLTATAHDDDGLLRAYAHCTPNRAGALTLLLLNLDLDEAVDVRIDGVDLLTPEVFELTAPDPHGREIRLNGTALALRNDGNLPELGAARRDGDAIRVPRGSYAFVVLPGADAAACR